MSWWGLRCLSHLYDVQSNWKVLNHHFNLIALFRSSEICTGIPGLYYPIFSLTLFCLVYMFFSSNTNLIFMAPLYCFIRLIFAAEKVQMLKTFIFCLYTLRSYNGYQKPYKSVAISLSLEVLAHADILKFTILKRLNDWKNTQKTVLDLLKKIFKKWRTNWNFLLMILKLFN